MRKRTYTALINKSDSAYCGENNTSLHVSKHNNETSVRKTTSDTDTIVDTTTINGSDQPDSSRGPMHPPSSYMNYTDTATCAGVDVVSDTPLTTIHNLVGTCEIASSTVPIDLEYVYKCLPNRYSHLEMHE